MQISMSETKDCHRNNPRDVCMLQHPSIFADGANCITWSCKRNSVKKKRKAQPHLLPPPHPKSPHPKSPHPTPPHPRSCPCPCPCPGSGPGPSLAQSLPYPCAIQFWQVIFSKLHKTDSRTERIKELKKEKCMWRVYKARLNCNANRTMPRKQKAHPHLAPPHVLALPLSMSMSCPGDSRSHWIDYSHGLVYVKTCTTKVEFHS